MASEELVSINGKKAPAKRGSYAPEQYDITGRHLDWLANQPNNHLIDVRYETEKFLDHHRAKGTLFKDWDAAWRNWMRRAIEWAPQRGTKAALNAITPQAVMTLWDD